MNQDSHYLMRYSRLRPKSALSLGIASFSCILCLSQAHASILARYLVPNEKEVAANFFIDVRGKVVDEQGKPLRGATIRLHRGKKDGSAITAETDENGVFVLSNMSDGAIIQISHVGFRSKEIKVAADLGLITLERDANELDEVNVTVNTGYQTLSRERSAGAFAKPDMGILAARSGTTNVVQRLDGLIPGLVINNSSSPTGNGSIRYAPSASSILIRGLNTINSNRDPLIVLNGVPIPLDDVGKINPNDVADITVLKDATSASIWGAKAANGVIVITTKKGVSQDAIKISYDGFINFKGKPGIEKLNMLNSQQFIEAAMAVFDPQLNNYNTISHPITGGIAPIMPHETILYNLDKLSQQQVDSKLAQLAGQDGLGQVKDLFYRNEVLTNHSLSINGGRDKYKFYGSGTYTGQLNSIPKDKNNTYGINLRQDFQFNKWLKVYLITDFTNNDVSSLNYVQPSGAFLPYVLFKNQDGSNADLSWLYRDDKTRMDYEQKSGVDLRYNPLDEVNRGRNTQMTNSGRVNSGVTVNLVKDLRYEGVFSFDKTFIKYIGDLDQDNYTVRSELASFTPLDGSEPYLPKTGGQHTVRNDLNKNWTVRNQLVYDRTWRDNLHQLVLLAGQEAQEQFRGTSSSVVRGYDSQLLSYTFLDYEMLAKGVNNVVMPNNLGNSSLYPDYFDESESRTRVSSYYANSGYTYANKYTLNLATRVDKSNLFGKDKSAQNKPVWSAGLSWQLGKEKFMRALTAVDMLVLRASYGLTGNSPNVGTAASKDILRALFASEGVLYPEGAGLSIITPSNSKLTWETTKNLNFGADFSLLKGRLHGALDVYHKKTENMIGNMPVNSLSGYSNITGNAGSMTNSGIDLVLNSVNIRTGNFKWSTALNLGYNKNKITKVNRYAPISRGETLISTAYVQDYPAFAIFAYDYAGLDKEGDPQIRLSDGTITKELGVAKVEDMKFMGTYQPKWSGGFSNLLAYRCLTFSMNAVYNLGHVMRRDVNTLYGGRGLVSDVSNNGMFSGNVNAEFANRWKKTGDEAFTAIPAYTRAPVAGNRGDMGYYMHADRNVIDASYVKLRDITLAYRVPANLLEKLKINDVTLRMQVSNIMLWKANDRGIDPEFMNGFGGWDGRSIATGIFEGGVRKAPTGQHSITFGANITF